MISPSLRKSLIPDTLKSNFDVSSIDKSKDIDKFFIDELQNSILIHE
jgi:hypothetical protein